MHLNGLPAKSVVGLISALAFAAPALGSNLYTTYSIGTDRSGIAWSTCGLSAGAHGCFASGTIGPLSGACAMIEGAPATAGKTTTRSLYVVEENPNNYKHVLLNIYTKTDTAAAQHPRTSIVFKKTIDLEIRAAANAACYVVGNKKFLYIATSISGALTRIDKAHLTTVFSPASQTAIHQITASGEGYVTVSYGNPSQSISTAFQVFDPEGNPVSDGGGPALMPNATEGVSLK